MTERKFKSLAQFLHDAAVQDQIRSSITEAEEAIAAGPIKPLDPETALTSTIPPGAPGFPYNPPWLDVKLNQIETELEGVAQEETACAEDRMDLHDTTDDHTIRIITLTDALAAAEQRMDKLRDRLYEHEKVTKTAMDGLAGFVDAIQDELTDINGLDGNRLDHIANAIHEHNTSFELQASVNDGVLTRLEALERAVEDPASVYKIQYRFGREPWKDFESDTLAGTNYLPLPSQGSTIALRMVRK